MAKKAQFEYIEDNGGGLHLFIFDADGNVIDGITNLEHAQRGEWNDVKDEMMRDAAKAVVTWDGHMRDEGIDPAEFYAYIQSHEFGYATVCDNGTLYPDKMGNNAQYYFGIERE